jgi:PTS system nitrogen regulatory IIA component
MKIDISTAARLIGTPETTLRRWVRQGKIPGRYESGVYMFNKGELIKWAHRRNIPLAASPPYPPPAPATGEIRLYEAMKSGGAFFDVPGADVREVFEAVSKLIPLTGTVDGRILLDRLLQREDLVSTGVGNGVAIPHPRYPMEDIPAGGMVSTFFLEREIDFKAVDGLPVFVLFIILDPDTKTHLKLLSRLGFCLREEGFIGFLRECRTGDDLLIKVREMEDRIEANGKKEGS